MRCHLAVRRSETLARRLYASGNCAAFVDYGAGYHAGYSLARAMTFKTMSTVIFSMHSCTPIFGNDPPRPWHIGVIAHSDWRIGDALIDLLAAETDLCVGRNKPYEVAMDIDYTVPIHAEGRGLPYVEIEIRQDLIGDARGQLHWAELLSGILPRVVERSGVLTG